MNSPCFSTFSEDPLLERSIFDLLNTEEKYSTPKTSPVKAFEPISVVKSFKINKALDTSQNQILKLSRSQDSITKENIYIDSVSCLNTPISSNELNYSLFKKSMSYNYGDTEVKILESISNKIDMSDGYYNNKMTDNESIFKESLSKKSADKTLGLISAKKLFNIDNALESSRKQKCIKLINLNDSISKQNIYADSVSCLDILNTSNKLNNSISQKSMTYDNDVIEIEVLKSLSYKNNKCVGFHKNKIANSELKFKASISKILPVNTLGSIIDEKSFEIDDTFEASKKQICEKSINFDSVYLKQNIHNDFEFSLNTPVIINELNDSITKKAITRDYGDTEMNILQSISNKSHKNDDFDLNKLTFIKSNMKKLVSKISPVKKSASISAAKLLKIDNTFGTLKKDKRKKSINFNDPISKQNIYSDYGSCLITPVGSNKLNDSSSKKSLTYNNGDIEMDQNQSVLNKPDKTDEFSNYKITNSQSKFKELNENIDLNCCSVNNNPNNLKLSAFKKNKQNNNSIHSKCDNNSMSSIHLKNNCDYSPMHNNYRPPKKKKVPTATLR